MNRSQSPSTALRAPSPPLGEKDGMRGYGSWRGKKLDVSVRLDLGSTYSVQTAKHAKYAEADGRADRMLAIFVTSSGWPPRRARQRDRRRQPPLPFDCWSRTKSMKVVGQACSAFCAPAHGCYL